MKKAIRKECIGVWSAGIVLKSKIKVSRKGKDNDIPRDE
jgi:hypothetical protein